MVPAYATVDADLVLLLVVEVGTDHLVGGESLASASESSTSATTAGEALVVGVVGIGHEEELHVVHHHTTEDTACVAVLGTCGEVGIDHHTLVHAGLDAEVEHGLFLAVLNTRDAGEVALLVVGLDAVDDVRGQVLHGGLCVARHELLTIDEDLLHLLTVDLDGTVVADLCSRQTAYEFLDDGAFGRAEGVGIIDEGVGLEGYLRGVGRHRGTLQHDGIGLDLNGAGMVVLTVLDVDFLRIGLETYIRHLKGVTAVAGGLDREGTVGVGDCVGYYFLTTEQGGGGLDDGLLCILFYNLSCYCALSECRDRNDQCGHQKC